MIFLLLCLLYGPSLQADVSINAFTKTSAVNGTIVLTCDVFTKCGIGININFKVINGSKYIDVDEDDHYFWSPMDRRHNQNNFKTLTISNVTRKHKKEYYCFVTCGNTLNATESYNLTDITTSKGLLHSVNACPSNAGSGCKEVGSNDRSTDGAGGLIYGVLGASLVVAIVLITLLVGRRTFLGKKKSNFYRFEEGVDETYDVFLCYSPKDLHWVSSTLIEELKKQQLKVCSPISDYIPGRFEVENMAGAIFASKKTIAVLSPDFLDDTLCYVELQTALSRMDHHRVIPILYKPCELPAALSDKTYLAWCYEDVKPYFWTLLFHALNKDSAFDIIDAAI